MVSKNELINLINECHLSDRLEIVEAVLKHIRKEKKALRNGLDILEFAGIIDDTEAKIFESAVLESRKIDKNEW